MTALGQLANGGQSADLQQKTGGPSVASASPFLTVPEIALFLRVSTDTVYELARHIGADSLPNYRVGGRLLFDPAEVLEWVKTQRRGTSLSPLERGKRFRKPRKRRRFVRRDRVVASPLPNPLPEVASRW